VHHITLSVLWRKLVWSVKQQQQQQQQHYLDVNIVLPFICRSVRVLANCAASLHLAKWESVCAYVQQRAYFLSPNHTYIQTYLSFVGCPSIGCRHSSHM